MDEYNTGMDREVKIYFRKILKSFGIGLFWLMLCVIVGLFLKLGHVQNAWRWQNTVFYLLLLLSLAVVIRYMYKIWKD